MKQTEYILKYMREKGSITPLDALREFGCMRLTSRIWDLKQQGHKIIKETECSKNRYGKPISYARYRLEEGETDGRSKVD